MRTVEGDGIMAGTPEVAIKLQEMYPEPAPGFEYDFTRELKETFVADSVGCIVGAGTELPASDGKHCLRAQ